MNKTGVTNCRFDLVFDIGAHKGEDSAFYLKLGYRVMAVEAHPELAELLRQRFQRELADGTFILVDKAIGEGEGAVDFFVNEEVSVWGTTSAQWASRNEGLGAGSRIIEVECVPFSSLVSRFGCPFYLKIDIEGADMLCVNALKSMDCRPAHVSIESTKTSWADLLNEFDTLETLGYTKFKVINQKKHRSGRYTHRDGQKVQHVFESDSSGPFGADLRGAWLTKRQAICKYLFIFLLYSLLGDNTALSKILNGIPVARRLLGLVSWYDTHAVHESVSR